MNYRNIVFALLFIGALGAYKLTTAHNNTITVDVSDSVHRSIQVRNNVAVGEDSDFDFDFDFDFDVDFDSESIDKEVVLDRKFSVNNGDLLVVNIEHSDLVVESGASNAAHIRVVLESNNLEKARDFYESLNYSVEEIRGGVEITANRTRNNNWNWNSREQKRITVLVSLPTSFNYDVRMSHGDAFFDDISGNVEINVSHGDLETSSIDGDDLRIKLSHGDYVGSDLIGTEISLNASHGDIDVRSVTAGRIDASLSHGDIDVASASGELYMNNSHGDIDVGVKRAADSRFSNSHGDISIVALSDLAADVDFSGASVRMSSGVNFSGTLKKDRAEGQIRGGGPVIVARTSHGSVSLRN